IYGAGDAGELLVREMWNNDSLGLVPIGFVDDDPTKKGKLIHGIRVMGTSASLADLLPELEVQEIVISSEKVDEARLTAVADLCKRQAVPFRRARFALE